MKENEEFNQTKSDESNRISIDIEDILILIDQTESKKDRGERE